MSRENIPTHSVYKYNEAYRSLVSPQNEHEIASYDVLQAYESLKRLQDEVEEIDRALLPEIVP